MLLLCLVPQVVPHVYIEALERLAASCNISDVHRQKSNEATQATLLPPIILLTLPSLHFRVYCDGGHTFLFQLQLVFVRISQQEYYRASLSRSSRASNCTTSHYSSNFPASEGLPSQ